MRYFISSMSPVAPKEAIKEKYFLETIVSGMKDHMMVIDLD